MPRGVFQQIKGSAPAYMLIVMRVTRPRTLHGTNHTMAREMLQEPLLQSIWQHSTTAKDPNCRAAQPRTVNKAIKGMVILLRGEPKATDST